MLKNITISKITLLLFCLQLTTPGTTQSEVSELVSNLKLRGIGPALMGGRIADIAISPEDRSTWYVAAGSGNLWKTVNSGITWEPVFDDQPSYSIGCVSIDPQNPATVWVGTGENVSGRHVAWGDGVYRSLDGGTSWRNMGLNNSEHIGRILVDPTDSKIVLVAAEGPLWSSGGDRGVFRTEDGGETWEQVLKIDEDTGVTDLEFDPSDPNVVYAASYQRRRHTWAFLSGGPKSGIYKSTDNGETWREVTSGLPKGDMGKIGLAVTPANPNLVYATIEADDNEKGFYRSEDKGESWEKQNSYISGGTGPHYYQEIEASPTDPDLVYQMDVFLHVTRDGGKSFDYLTTGHEKHSDNHAMWIDPDNPRHLIAGTDAGLYETFDEGATWRHFPNLPISQFYKLGLDNSEPFYNIVGGAQDLGTLIGPSRTLNAEGVRNRDWYVPLGADGYSSHFDPVESHIAYMEYQQGVLFRLDRRSEEVLNIQPQAAPGDAPERWNWDSPLLISPHDHKKLYFCSQRVWRSNDRGDSWTPISEDLTTNTNRYELEFMGRVWSVDDLYDNGAMSKYATITAITESPVEEGVLYTGSDDGLVHATEDGGENWYQGGVLPGVPERSFINDVKASQHDASTVFAVADAHKFGDFNPYVFMSSDRGRSWQSIAGDLPEGTIVWAIEQDHEDADLLFIGTEFGLYYSYNKGVNWVKLGGGVPTIAFRDIEIHRRDNDLVGATFGRGFYILDDYSPLRTLDAAAETPENSLFPIRDAWWYIPSIPMQAKGMPTLGSTSFVADNAPFGATFTYLLTDIPTSAKMKRKESEKELRNDDRSIPFPGWDQLREEATEGSPQTLLLVRNSAGDPVRWVQGANTKGLHRVYWDLRLAAKDPIDLSESAFTPPWNTASQGPLAPPGDYTVELFIEHDGELISQSEVQRFTVKPVPTTVEGVDYEAISQFQKQTSELMRQVSSASSKLSEVNDRLRHIDAALKQTPTATVEHFAMYRSLIKELAELRMDLSGDPVRQRLDESTAPSIYRRVGYVTGGHWDTRQNPTATQRESIEIAESEFNEFEVRLDQFLTKLKGFETDLETIGAPYTRGRD